MSRGSSAPPQRGGTLLRRYARTAERSRDARPSLPATSTSLPLRAILTEAVEEFPYPLPQNGLQGQNFADFFRHPS